MKFGKTAEAAFATIAAEGVSAFPYRRMKKQLNTTISNHAGNSVHIRHMFLEALQLEVRACDREWQDAAQAVTRQRARVAWMPHTFYRRLRDDTTADLSERAQRLEEWSKLAQEALRKLIKKYNKKCGASCGSLDLSLFKAQFIDARARINCMDPMAEAPSCELGVQACTVCGDLLADPVDAPCGHAVCRRCFEYIAMRSHAPGMLCADCASCRALSQCKEPRHATASPVHVHFFRAPAAAKSRCMHR